MTNKTISINPSLFNVGSLTKTKKNRDKNSKPNNVPLISPNKLKDRILKRIKEHKLKETESLQNEKEKNNDNDFETKKEKNIDKYTDEFNESIQYLQSLSEQRKRENQENDYAKKVERRKQELQRKTLKSYDNPHNIPEVNLELPDELKEPVIIQNVSYQVQPIQVNQAKFEDTVPYGILKGGSKPTYRQWARTHKNPPIQIHSENQNGKTQQPLVVQNSSIRENKLHMLKKKMLENNQNHNNNNNSSQKGIINNPNTNLEIQSFNSSLESFQNINSDNQNHNSPQVDVILPSVTQLAYDNLQFNNSAEKQNDVMNRGTPYKKIIKRTIRKKYKLGKSKNKRQIGILIKDSQTRKNIINSQKELKKTPLKDCKKYLHSHNILNIGGGTPNDVIRATYESAMMAGEITNINKETLLNNIMKDDII